MKVPGVGRGEPTLGVVSFEIEESILPQIEGPHAAGRGDGATIRCDRGSSWRRSAEGLAAIMERAPLAPPTQ